jgi:hypothetical protein
VHLNCLKKERKEGRKEGRKEEPLLHHCQFRNFEQGAAYNLSVKSTLSCADYSEEMVMLKVLFDSQGIIHHEFIPEKRNIKKTMFRGIFYQLQEVIHHKHHHLWVSGNWLSPHDKPPPCQSITEQECLEKGITVFPQPEEWYHCVSTT